MNIATFKKLGFGTLLVGTTALGTLLAVRARAAGIPDAAALTYTGYLENPDGTPVTGQKGIGLSVYDAETDGNEVCALKPVNVEPVAGRFQLALPEKCTPAVKANPDLWVEIQVEGSLLGRTKLGAVPYAVEAAHAVQADSAAPASPLESSLTVAAATSKYVADHLGPKADSAADWRWGTIHAAAVGACAALSTGSHGGNPSGTYVLGDASSCNQLCAKTATTVCRGAVAVSSIDADRAQPSALVGNTYVYSCDNAQANLREKAGLSPDSAGLFSYCCCSDP